MLSSNMTHDDDILMADVDDDQMKKQDILLVKETGRFIINDLE